MTVKQGQDINQRFIDLTSDIQKLKDSLNTKKIETDSLSSEKVLLNSSLNLNISKSNRLEEENKKLKILLDDREEIHMSERRKWTGWMFFSFVVTVMVGALK